MHNIYHIARNFRLEKIFAFFHPLLSWAKFLYHDFFYPLLMHRAYGNLYCMGEIYSTEHFCNAKVTGLGETFVQQKFSAIYYSQDELFYVTR